MAQVYPKNPNTKPTPSSPLLNSIQAFEKGGHTLSADVSPCAVPVTKLCPSSGTWLSKSHVLSPQLLMQILLLVAADPQCCRGNEIVRAWSSALSQLISNLGTCSQTSMGRADSSVCPPHIFQSSFLSIPFPHLFFLCPPFTACFVPTPPYNHDQVPCSSTQERNKGGWVQN